MAQTSAINLSVRATAASRVFLIENLLKPQPDQDRQQPTLRQAVDWLRGELAKRTPTQPAQPFEVAGQLKPLKSAQQQQQQPQQQPQQQLQLQQAGKGQHETRKPPARRRSRTLFADWQLKSLEFRFARNKYLTTGDRVKIARVLGLEQLQVKTWFQVSWLPFAGCSLQFALYRLPFIVCRLPFAVWPLAFSLWLCSAI